MRDFDWMNIPVPCPVCSTTLVGITPDGKVTCSHCGLSVTYEELDEILQFAYEAATYGYLYPKAEGRPHAQKRHERYSLVTDPYLVWLALAALTGIVGNLSYDIIKTVMRRVVGKKKTIPIISKGKTSLKTREIHLKSKVEITVPVTNAEFDMMIAAVVSYVAKCRKELSGGTFDPPTTKDVFVKTLLAAQKQQGWERGRKTKEELEEEYESFRAHYAQARKKSMARVESCREILEKVCTKMRKTDKTGTESSNNTIEPTR